MKEEPNSLPKNS